MLGLIFVKEEGDSKVTFLSDLHSLKHSLPRNLTEEGIVICSNSQHPEKALHSMVVTEEGIIFCFNEMQALKA